ncbi:MAG: secondary thiamine-phosphate synthase enzyme YjbQ [Candidatus Omnitrophota bacterium]
MRTIDITTKNRSELIDITSELKQSVKAEKINNGICVVFCPHTTGALTINENADPSVKSDILNHLEKLVPVIGPYEHQEGNSDSHVKSALTGISLILIVNKGELVLGTWQSVYFCEFDGPRRRKIYTQTIG